MNRGQIVFWTFTTNNINRGRIGGCFNGVHGERFGFTIRDVADEGLAAFLRATPSINETLNCDPLATEAFWVVFRPEGNRARDIQRD